jgi:hypothetical protein
MSQNPRLDLLIRLERLGAHVDPDAFTSVEHVNGPYGKIYLSGGQHVDVTGGVRELQRCYTEYIQYKQTQQDETNRRLRQAEYNIDQIRGQIEVIMNILKEKRDK